MIWRMYYWLLLARGEMRRGSNISPFGRYTIIKKKWLTPTRLSPKATLLLIVALHSVLTNYRKQQLWDEGFGQSSPLQAALTLATLNLSTNCTDCVPCWQDHRLFTELNGVWGCYARVSQLKALHKWLDRRGVRERVLKVSGRRNSSVSATFCFGEVVNTLFCSNFL